MIIRMTTRIEEVIKRYIRDSVAYGQWEIDISSDLVFDYYWKRYVRKVKEGQQLKICNCPYLLQRCNWTVEEIIEFLQICNCKLYFDVKSFSWYRMDKDKTVAVDIQLPFQKKDTWDRCMRELHCRFALCEIGYSFPEEIIDHIISF